jgi:polysaccharide deacetylase 2 family uncharacterized protein YibQ
MARKVSKPASRRSTAKPAAKRKSSSKSRRRKTAASGISLQRFFVGAMRLALVSLGIFAVGLILGLYFSHTPPGEPVAGEDRQIVAEEPEAYRLSPVPQPPKPKPQIVQRPEVLPQVKAAAPAPAPVPEPAVLAPEVEKPVVPQAVVAPARQATWLRNAVAVDAPQEKPWIAIVLDDVGVNRSTAWEAIDLPPPLTLAFMTYASDLPRMTQAARERGHELMVHFPMEPSDIAHNDPGENALLLGLSRNEIERRLDWGLARFEGYVGVNNHMGSRYTEDAEALKPVMAALKERGLLFLDSRTSARSVAGGVARRAGLPVIARDVFLDHEPTSSFVVQQLEELETIAQRRGYAVGIGHPQSYTLEVLREWIPSARERGFVIVPLTAIVMRRGEVG